VNDSDRTRTSALPAGERPGTVKAAGRLAVVYPRDLAVCIELQRQAIQIGRIPAEVPSAQLAHPTISRTHARVSWDGRAKTHVIQDLGSHNGTSVDGVALQDQTCLLADGAVVRLGDALAVYEAGGLPPATPAVSRDAIPGDARPMGLLRQQVSLCATDPSPVLLIGDTGAGKERIVDEVHRLSNRSGPLRAVNCAALSPQLVESQLFGHVKGAFTGAESNRPGLFRDADGGTLFLDEIGELPLDQQTKFLRVLENREVTPVGGTRATAVDVRVVAATNADLYQRVQDGDFRRDLYARLAMWELRVPPLARRRGDILAWLELLHGQWCRDRGTEPAALPMWSANAAEILVRHEWPENLRGLNRLIHHVAPKTVTGDEIHAEDLPHWHDLTPDAEGSSAVVSPTTSTKKTASTLRRPAPSREDLLACLEKHDWSIRSVARHFDRDRRQIYRWMKQFGLERPS